MVVEENLRSYEWDIVGPEEANAVAAIKRVNWFHKV